MLILTRKEYESTVIRCPNGETIEVVHCGTRNGGRQTKFGFIAPEGYKILRGELLDQQEAA